MKHQPESISRRKERILVVDDNEPVVTLARFMLEHLGYKVTGFTDGQEALKVFCEKPSEFDLVITDYVMPHLTGKDLAEKMIHIRSDIPIILWTAYSDFISLEKAMALGFRGFILKPFTFQEVAELMRRVLDQKESGLSK